MSSAARWAEVLIRCGVRAPRAADWCELFAAVIQAGTFSAGAAEVDDWLGQVLEESALLERLEEGLFYKTPGRLMATWPARFPSLESELPYLRNPAALAEKVYGGRMGNGPEGSGDGWRYRGSGLIQVTGAENFHALQRLTGIPVYDKPELLRTPTREALEATIAWWEGHVPDSVMGNIQRVTKAVNGGAIGLAERKRLTDEADGADGLMDGELSV